MLDSIDLYSLAQMSKNGHSSPHEVPTTSPRGRQRKALQMGVKEEFGSIELRRTNEGARRYRAYYTHALTRHRAPTTFTRKDDARGWLKKERDLIESGAWTSPAARQAAASVVVVKVTFGEYAESWLTERDIRPLTKASYRALLDAHLMPEFGRLDLEAITPKAVAAWWGRMDKTKTTTRARAYSLLRTIMNTALSVELIDANPCRVKGGAVTKRKHKPVTLEVGELVALADAMPEHHRALTLLTGLCGLRFGEAAALRRSDVDLEAGIVRVRRGVVRVKGKKEFGPTKTDAGTRDLYMPKVVTDAMREHLRTHIAGGRHGLVFPGKGGEALAPSALYGRATGSVKGKRKRKDGTTVVMTVGKGFGFYEARRVIGKPDLRWHDLRHTGAVLYARTGATTKDLQARLGHTTAQAAMIYQHTAAERDRMLTGRLDDAITEAGL